jgi:antimicrobial peptide system SdpB family protein
LSALSDLRRAAAIINPVGLGRAVLALGSLSTLLLTQSGDLFIAFAPHAAESRCVGIGGAGAFCLSNTLTGSPTAGVILSVIVLLLILTGFGARTLAVPHFYVAWSVSQNVVVVEGGDQVNAVMTLLLIPWILATPRGNAWLRTTPFLGALSKNAFAYGAAELIRVQLAVVYVVAAIAKLAVPQWSEGTALWYWLQVPGFGVPTDVFGVIAPVLELPLVMVTATYAVMVFEVLLAVSIWMRGSFARTILYLGIVFHAGIAVVLGLWSFGITMTGALLLCLALQKGNVFFVDIRRSVERTPTKAEEVLT